MVHQDGLDLAEQRNRALALAYQHMGDILQAPDIGAFEDPNSPPRKLPRDASPLTRAEHELAQCKLEKNQALHE